MIDVGLSSSERERLLELDVDWRNAFYGRVEEEWVAYPSNVAHAAATRALEPKGYALVEGPCEPMRRLPAHSSELISEARMGEFLLVLAIQDGWWLVQSEDRYIGWLRAWSSRESERSQLDALIARRCGRFRLASGVLVDASGAAVAPLMMGTPLLASTNSEERRDGFERVDLANGASGFVGTADIDTQAPRGTSAELVDWALQRMGSSYRWGGRAGESLDCSGFVQLAALLAGFDLPRDSPQQSICGEPVTQDASAWALGDLLFFHEPVDHVAVYAGQETVLHARGRVVGQRLDEVEDLMRGLVSVRRLCEKDHTASSTLWSVVPQPPSS